jgi:hypothetical protein
MCGEYPVLQRYRTGREPYTLHVGITEDKVIHELLCSQAAGQQVYRGQEPEVPVIGWLLFQMAP